MEAEAEESPLDRNSLTQLHNGQKIPKFVQNKTEKPCSLKGSAKSDNSFLHFK